MVHFMLSVYLHTFMVYINTGLLVHNTKLYQLGAQVCINFFIIIFVLLGIVWDTLYYVKHIKCGPEDLGVWIRASNEPVRGDRRVG